MEPHHNTMIQFFKGGSTEIKMLLYFALFLIFQITATKSLYIDNHPAYFEDSQIEQVSAQLSDCLSTSRPKDLLKSQISISSSHLRFKVHSYYEPNYQRQLGKSTVHVLQNLNKREKEMLQEFFWFDHPHPHSQRQQNFFV